MQKKGYDCECLGGGRISHQSQDRKIHVYGYSMVSPHLRAPVLAGEHPALLSHRTLPPGPAASRFPGGMTQETGWVGATVRPPWAVCCSCPEGLAGPLSSCTSSPPALRGRQHCVGARAPASPFTTLPAGSRGTQSQLGLWLEGPPSRLAHPGGHISPRRVARVARGMTASSPAGSWCPCCLGAPRARTGHVRATFFLQGYGRAQHSVSTEKIKAKYPDYEVTWADDGY